MTATTNPSTLLGDNLDERFTRWVADHGADVSRFVQLAKQQKDRGRRVSAKALIEHMRMWEDPPLRDFDNTLTSRLARFVMAGWPELADYFVTRTLKPRPKGRRP